MIKNTLVIASFLAASCFSLVSYAEEPYIGIGMVKHTHEQKFDSVNDFEAEPTAYRLTLGSRIAKNWVMEAYYLETKDADEIDIGTRANPVLMDIEYKTILGASINWGYTSGPIRIYAGPNVTAAKVSAKTVKSNPALDAFNEKDTRFSPGIGAGIDIKPFKHFSFSLGAQSYYWADDILGVGFGGELRYHL